MSISSKGTSGSSIWTTGGLLTPGTATAWTLTPGISGSFQFPTNCGHNWIEVLLEGRLCIVAWQETNFSLDTIRIGYILWVSGGEVRGEITFAHSVLPADFPQIKILTDIIKNRIAADPELFRELSQCMSVSSS